jgi:hypothetical protein
VATGDVDVHDAWCESCHLKIHRACEDNVLEGHRKCKHCRQKPVECVVCYQLMAYPTKRSVLSVRDAWSHHGEMPFSEHVILECDECGGFMHCDCVRNECGQWFTEWMPDDHIDDVVKQEHICPNCILGYGYCVNESDHDPPEDDESKAVDVSNDLTHVFKRKRGNRKDHIDGQVVLAHLRIFNQHSQILKWRVTCTHQPIAFRVDFSSQAR